MSSFQNQQAGDFPTGSIQRHICVAGCTGVNGRQRHARYNRRRHAGRPAATARTSHLAAAAGLPAEEQPAVAAPETPAAAEAEADVREHGTPDPHPKSPNHINQPKPSPQNPKNQDRSTTPSPSRYTPLRRTTPSPTTTTTATTQNPNSPKSNPSPQQKRRPRSPASSRRQDHPSRI